MKHETLNRIKKIFVQKSALKYSGAILSKLNSDYALVDDEAEIPGGKSTLLLAVKKAGFVKKCPCSPDSVSCNYYNVNYMEGCFFDCSYCILQLYLRNKPLTVYVNFDDIIKELEAELSKNKFIRIGPGELADSLLLENYTGFAFRLIDFFKDKNALFEIKTKDHNVESILNANHGGRTVVSFSVNSKRIVKSDEKFASNLEDRIKAAKICVDFGFPVAFHFDPVIIYPGWEREYLETVKHISHIIPVEKIKWISIGFLRFPLELKPLIKQSHRDSKLLTGELVKCQTGKMRYFIKLRQHGYDIMKKTIVTNLPGVNVYFCMETSFLWKKHKDMLENVKK